MKVIKKEKEIEENVKRLADGRDRNLTEKLIKNGKKIQNKNLKTNKENKERTK